MIICTCNFWYKVYILLFCDFCFVVDEYQIWKQNWASVLKVGEPTKKTEPVFSSKTGVHLHQATRRHDIESRTINIDRSVNGAVPSNPWPWNKQYRSMCSIRWRAPSDVQFYFPGLQDITVLEMSLGPLYRFRWS